MRAGWVAGLVGLVCVAGANAVTIRVPEDKPTVLAGLDAAVPGDSVLVGPGTWTARDTRRVRIGPFIHTVTACGFPRGGVTILGTHGADVTVIDGENAAEPTVGFQLLIFAQQFGSGTLVVEGLTFTGAGGGPNGGSGIVAAYVDGLTIRSCRFTGNTSADRADGTAITAVGVPIEIVNTDFVDNHSDSAIVFATDEDLAVRHCRFERNSSPCIDAGGGGPFGTRMSVRVHDTQFIENRGPGVGVCININGSNLTLFVIQRNIFSHNTAEVLEGGAIRVVEANGFIVNNLFAHNSNRVQSGACIYWKDCIGDIRRNTFVGSSSAPGRSAIFGGRSGWMRLENNVIANSTGGAAIRILGSELRLSTSCNIFWENDGGDLTGDPTLDATDRFVDPLFCDADGEDFSVQVNSPAIRAGCGQVGLFGVGCTSVSIIPTSWSRIKSLYRN